MSMGWPGWIVMVLTCLLSACATVEPWQRGNLARADMQLGFPAAERAFCAHIHAAKEAAAGGAGGSGGGCGCN